MSNLDVGVICGLLVGTLFTAIAAYVNGHKMNKRLNYMQEVLIKKGVVGEFDFTLALRGVKMHDEDDSM